MITIKPISPRQAEVQELIRALDEYQNKLYPAESNHLDPIETLAQSNSFFVGAYLDETLVGCGAVKRMPDGYGEIKRMFVRPEYRGQGAARAMMAQLEEHLLEHGVPVARLETGIYQPEALALYERLGYVRRGPFGAYGPDPFSLFMEKQLNGTSPAKSSPEPDKPSPAQGRQGQSLS